MFNKRQQGFCFSIRNDFRNDITAALIHSKYRHFILKTATLAFFYFLVFVSVLILSTDKGFINLNFCA